MGKRDAFWSQVPRDTEDHVQWPEDGSQREHLVRALFGATVVGALEAVLEDSLEVARGAKPVPGSNDYEREAARREVFAAMSDSQKAEVARLLRVACFRSLYWDSREA